MHKYTYAHNNPVNNVDPTGQFSLSELLTVATIIGGIMFAVVGTQTAIQTGSIRRGIEEGVKWFWISFFVTAAVYCAAWAIHSLWAYLAGGGVITAKESARHGFETHRDLVDAWKDIGYPKDYCIHHFVQKTAENIARFGKQAIHSILNSHPVDPKVHSIVNSFQQRAPSNVNLNPSAYDNVSHMYEYIQRLPWEEQYRWGVSLYLYILENGTWQGFRPENYGLS